MIGPQVEAKAMVYGTWTGDFWEPIPGHGRDTPGAHSQPSCRRRHRGRLWALTEFTPKWRELTGALGRQGDTAAMSLWQRLSLSTAVVEGSGHARLSYLSLKPLPGAWLWARLLGDCAAKVAGGAAPL